MSCLNFLYIYTALYIKYIRLLLEENSKYYLNSRMNTTNLTISKNKICNYSFGDFPIKYLIKVIKKKHFHVINLEY